MKTKECKICGRFYSHMDRACPGCKQEFNENISRHIGEALLHIL